MATMTTKINEMNRVLTLVQAQYDVCDDVWERILKYVNKNKLNESYDLSHCM